MFERFMTALSLWFGGFFVSTIAGILFMAPLFKAMPVGSVLICALVSAVASWLLSSFSIFSE